jgi:beta-galactosidase
MIFLKYIYLLILLTCALVTNPLPGQIIFKNLPQNDPLEVDSLFLDIGKTRKILPLNGSWKVYTANSDKIEKVNVEIPSVFEGESNLVFEKSFTLSASDISNHILKLSFLGLNYSADISLNNISIYRHTGGEFPFSLSLPKDVLHSDKANILSVRLSNKSDSKNTIPVKQKFQFPKSLGGIFRDVYIHFTPQIFVSDISSDIRFDAKTKKYSVTAKIKIENRELISSKDTLSGLESFALNLNLTPAASDAAQKFSGIKFQLSRNNEIYLTQYFELTSPLFWSPSNPHTYLLTAEITRNEVLKDRTTRSIAVHELTVNGESLLLNNQKFKIKGVTYYPMFEDFGGMITYAQMEKDIKLIYATGFNAVRFAKNIPHPFYLVLCQRYGLLPFIELPINSIPTPILEKEEFKNRTVNYINFLLKGFENYLVGGIGLGSSYSGNSEADIIFIENLAALVKKTTKVITYASFKDGKIAEIKNLDFYGIEINNRAITSSSLNQILVNGEFKAGKIFLSEASYLVSRGNSDGYLNDNSFEAQAKFFEDVIDYSNRNSLLGYFLNSMFDYRSDYASIISGHNKGNLLCVGLADENRNTDRIGYKVVYAKLNNTEKVTIPIGNKKDDSPMMFIITGILIAIIMGVMINSGKKFREDSSRALLRPYNFFADVRDQRLISGIHTLVIVFIIASTSGLLLSNILFYLKESVRFEKLLLSFGSSSLIQNVSYLAWNPLASIWWLSLLTIVALLILISIIKAASFFVKTRVAFSSIFHAVIWSFLPLVVLVPVGIILYRLLSVEAISIYLFIALLIFTVWIFYRLMKGIYVIFDTNPANVYLYSIIILFIIVVVFVIYFQLSNSTFTYMLHSLKDYKILG